MRSTANNLLTGVSSSRILVVDDDIHVRNNVARILAPKGFSCAQASNNDTAWKFLQEHDVHLVTLDVAMPGQSGIELLQRISESFPDLSVIMLTAVGGAEIAIEALTHGACGFLTKPINADELVFQVTRGLERSRLLVERRNYTTDLEKQVLAQSSSIRQAYEETILRLVNASKYRNEETGSHIKRVGLLSERLAQGIGWPASECERIRMAATMHDIGKIGIRDAVLLKAGTLTRDEFEHMKTHTTNGAILLSGSQSPMLQMAEEIAPVITNAGTVAAIHQVWPEPISPSPPALLPSLTCTMR